MVFDAERFGIFHHIEGTLRSLGTVTATALIRRKESQASYIQLR